MNEGTRAIVDELATYGRRHGLNRAARRAIRYKRGSKMTRIKGTVSPLVAKLLQPYLFSEQEPGRVVARSPIASDLETRALYSPI